LKNRNSGLCLDLRNNNSVNGEIIQLWPCTNQLVTRNDAQLWML
jgi:hypothetical protein